jgi:hypothetical protein
MAKAPDGRRCLVNRRLGDSAVSKSGHRKIAKWAAKHRRRITAMKRTRVFWLEGRR